MHQVKSATGTDMNMLWGQINCHGHFKLKNDPGFCNLGQEAVLQNKLLANWIMYHHINSK